MQNELLALIDQIDDTQFMAECDVMTALSDAYLKSALMMEMSVINEESIDETIYQEAAKESPIKRILMFLPRLLFTIIKAILRIITTVIAVVLSLILLPGIMIAAGIRAKRYDRESNEQIEINFNLQFLCEFIEEFGKFLSVLSDIKDESSSFNSKKSGKNPTVEAILSSKEYIELMRQYVNKFESQAYRKTTTTVGDANLAIDGLKAQEKAIKLAQRSLNKKLTGVLNDEDLTSEEQQTLREFFQICSDYAKKTTEFKQRLDVEMNKINEEKKGQTVKGLKNPTFEQYLESINFQARTEIGKHSASGAEITISIDTDEKIQANIKVFTQNGSGGWKAHEKSIITSVSNFSNDSETQNKLNEIAKKPMTFKVLL